MSIHDDLKKQAEKAGKELLISLALLAPSNSISAQISQPNNQTPTTELTPPTEQNPPSPDRASLKYDLKNMTPSEYFVPMEVISLSPQPQINQTLPFNPNKLDTSYYGGELDLEYCQIGNFTSEQLIKPQTPKELLKKAQKLRENTIKREATNPGVGGYYQDQTGNIRLSTSWLNSISPQENSVYYHEINHKYQAENCGLSSPQTTAINYAKANTLIEKTSSIAENLNLARAIGEFNKQGISTVEYISTYNFIDNVETPVVNHISLKSLLQDHHPELAKILLDDKGNIVDFSPSNPNYKDLQDKIIKAICQDWDNNYKKIYEEQESISQYKIDAPGMFNELSFSKKIKAIQNEDKHYNEVTSKILKKVHIGFEETVDLTQYKDIIDTSPITAKDTKFREAEHPSRKTLLAINDYLISKGITSDKDKDAYMDKAFRDIVSKSPEADITLARLMLTDKQVTNKIPLEIHHADGDVTRFDGLAFISTVQDNDYLYKPQPELNASHGNTQATNQNNGASR